MCCLVYLNSQAYFLVKYWSSYRNYIKHFYKNWKMPHPGQRFCDKFPAARSDKMTNAWQTPVGAGGGRGRGELACLELTEAWDKCFINVAVLLLCYIKLKRKESQHSMLTLKGEHRSLSVWYSTSPCHKSMTTAHPISLVECTLLDWTSRTKTSHNLKALLSTAS